MCDGVINRARVNIRRPMVERIYPLAHARTHARAHENTQQSERERASTHESKRERARERESEREREREQQVLPFATATGSNKSAFP